MGKGGNVKTQGKLFIALLCVLISCFASSPAVLALPAGAEIAADSVVAEIEPLATNRTIQEIAALPEVKAAIDAAWEDSNAGNATHRHEEGGWIIEDASGNITIQRWPSGDRDGIAPGPTPVPPEGGRVVGHFHTHPNPPTDENGTQWEQGPSEADNNFADNRNLPGIVRNAAGTEFFGPGS
jgi:hypothetical protein